MPTSGENAEEALQNGEFHEAERICLAVLSAGGQEVTSERIRALEVLRKLYCAKPELARSIALTQLCEAASVLERALENVRKRTAAIEPILGNSCSSDVAKRLFISREALNKSYREALDELDIGMRAKDFKATTIQKKLSQVSIYLEDLQNTLTQILDTRSV